MTEVVYHMYHDGEAREDIRTLYANRGFLLKKRDVIMRNPELHECNIRGVYFGMMYSGGPDIDFLHLLEEWQRADSPLVQVNANGNICYTHAAGGSPLSGTNRCHAYCPVENAHYILHYTSLRIPLSAMAGKGCLPRRPEPYKPAMCTPGSFAVFSRQDISTLLPVDCCDVYNPVLSLDEVLMLLHAEEKKPGLADRVATVARLRDAGRYLQLQWDGENPVLWVYDAADMTEAHRAYCVGLDDLQQTENTPAGVATIQGLEQWNPTKDDKAELRHILSSYSKHWGGITVADFAWKQAQALADRMGVSS